MLLLLFAAVVLGGIGTVYGAVLGALLIGIVTQVSTYWINPEAKNAVAFLVLIGVLLVRPQGILGPPGADRLSSAFQDAIAAGLGIQAAAFALAAVGLNLQFGYTGLLNFGHGRVHDGRRLRHRDHRQRGRPAVAGGAGRDRRLGRCSAWSSGCRRCGCAPTTWPSSPSLPARSLRIIINAGGQNSLTQGPFGIQQFANSFFKINPFPTGTYGPGRVRFSESDLWVMTVTWALVAVSSLRRLPARSQPLGTGRSRPSARTRTPLAAWARTSSPTSSRASAWAA